MSVGKAGVQRLSADLTEAERRKIATRRHAEALRAFLTLPAHEQSIEEALLIVHETEELLRGEGIWPLPEPPCPPG